MIPKECKRLAEVDFPIAVVSAHAAREKTLRHGHPSTLHLWWARRPLASSRAVLLGLLLPDPCDSHCPAEFKRSAREILAEVRQAPRSDEDLQKALLWFIGAFANWDMAANRTYLKVARELVRAAHPEEPPLVVDPFAGGGSIPLEALRLGCEAFASDLNPVACLILKVVLEDIPRYGPKLAEDLRRAGAAIKRQAEKEMADLYPSDPDGATPIAYLWARTVRCESPNCGAEIPLMRSLWLSKKAKRKRAFRYSVLQKGESSIVEFEIFTPNTDDDVPKATVSRAKATCPACHTVLAADRVRAQLTEQRGGADAIFDDQGCRVGGARLLAVVTLKPGDQGRRYRLGQANDYKAVWKATLRLRQAAADTFSNDLSRIPNEPLPPIGTLGFRVQRYGMLQWSDLFSARQKVALCTIAELVCRSKSSGVAGHLAALVHSKHAELLSANCPWEPVAECPRKTYNMQALPMRWEFAEAVVISDSSGGLATTLDNVLFTLANVGSDWKTGTVDAADACEHPLPDLAADIWFTDPPYYDAIPYGDLSDFFFVWLKRTQPDLPVRLSQNDNPMLTPKELEIVQDETRYFQGNRKNASFFEDAMGRAFSAGARAVKSNGMGCVVFAHKTTEGWEALLAGMLRGGWVVTASWPIQTEQVNRPRARDSAALATSVHLVCRPRSADARVGDWADVLRELPTRVGDWMERLQREGVRGADLLFACIGPALEIFSRYAKVETADGREVELAKYLEKVWEVVGRSALSQVLGTANAKARNGAAGAVEEDARLTALFLWTLQSTNGEAAEGVPDESEANEPPDEDEDEEGSSRAKAKGFTLVFDVVRRFAQPLGIDLPQWEGRIIETKKGVVRLLPIAERAKQLFGEDGAQAVAARLEQEATIANPLQEILFPEMRPGGAPTIRGRGRRGKRAGLEVSDETLAAAREATTLDRVHAAMLLQAGGRTNALRALLRAEQERSPDFLRLANAFSALYPKGSEEKRLVDAMLLAVPR